MNKTKLAICMQDLEYQARFVNCFMNHYKHQYEVHVFTNLEELKASKPLEFSVIITGEYTTEELTNFVERGEIILALTESGIGEKNKEHHENITYTEKYQEVYKIAERLPLLATARESDQRIAQKPSICKRVGVYSLSHGEYQIPFAALLAKLYGEEERVLVVDIQSYSGLAEEEIGPHMGLEDMMSVASTGAYRRSRLLSCIGHEANWDYVYPVKNNQCLLEGSKELYESILETLEQELDYQRIIINFGDIYFGQLDMMSQCQDFYLLTGKSGLEANRENNFCQELERSGKADLLARIKKIEIPTHLSAEENWRGVLEKWYWNSFGKEICHGLSM